MADQKFKRMGWFSTSIQIGKDSYTYAIDLTHPEVQKWLKTTFETLKSLAYIL